MAGLSVCLGSVDFVENDNVLKIVFSKTIKNLKKIESHTVCTALSFGIVHVSVFFTFMGDFPSLPRVSRNQKYCSSLS